MLPPSLLEAAKNYFNSDKIKFIPLKADGSNRIMFKICFKSKIYLGVYFQNIEVNKRFIAYANHFQKLDLPVPQVLSVSQDQSSYITSYLGDKNMAEQIKNFTTSELINCYQKIIPWVDIIYKKGKDLMRYYPNQVFDQKLYQADWDYFDEHFIKYLKLEKIRPLNFNTSAKKLINNLSKFKNDGFVHRDLQVRNIMWFKNKLWFIDFQDGMLGPKYYDLASLLFGGSSQLEFDNKKILWQNYFKLDETTNNPALYQFLHMALIRKIRSLGTYAKLGVAEKRDSFKKPLTLLIKDTIGIGQVGKDKENLYYMYPELFEFLASCLTHIKN